jgi:hypothetical protein
MKKVFLILIFQFAIKIHCQEIIKSYDINLENSDVFQIVDEKEKEVSIFLIKKKDVQIINLDSEFNIKDSISINTPEKKFKSIVGFSKKNNEKYIYWTKGGTSDIIIQKIDFENKKTTESKSLIDTKNETKIIELSLNNAFYLITSIKKTNQLKIHKFNGEDKTEKIIDFDNTYFYNSLNEKINLYDLLNENLLPFETAFKPQLIDDSSPVSLTSSSKKRKYYIKSDTLFLTFDNNTKFTQILKIDLQNWLNSSFSISKPEINDANNFMVNSNSYLIENTLAQIKLNNQVMVLTFKDLNNNLIKEYQINKEDSLSFKNSDIIQLGSEFNSTDIRILSKTSQFLRKLNNLNPGLSFYKIGDNYQTVIGSVSEIRNNSYMGMFGASGVILYYMTTNPTFDNFNSYSNRKVVYINSNFDSKGEFYKEKYRDNLFDKIQEFKKNEKELSTQTIFKFLNDFYFGYFSKKEKKYLLLRFKE